MTTWTIGRRVKVTAPGPYHGAVGVVTEVLKTSRWHTDLKVRFDAAIVYRVPTEQTDSLGHTIYRTVADSFAIIPTGGVEASKLVQIQMFA